MLPHTFQANKYQMQAAQFANIPSMIIALCEKSISCIASAQEALSNQNKEKWRANLSIVQDALQLISSTMHHSKNSNELEEIKKFYDDLWYYTTGLIEEKIDSSKAQDLLESFRITRDMWKEIEKKYVDIKSTNNGGNSSNVGGVL